MKSASIAFHVLGALRRAIGRVILWFFVLLIVAAITVEIVGYIAAGQHIVTLTHVAAAIMGVILGYAAALTVLVGEVVRFFVKTLRDAEQELKGEIGAGAKIVDTVIEGVENLEKKI